MFFGLCSNCMEVTQLMGLHALALLNWEDQFAPLCPLTHILNDIVVTTEFPVPNHVWETVSISKENALKK